MLFARPTPYAVIDTVTDAPLAMLHYKMMMASHTARYVAADTAIAHATLRCRSPPSWLAAATCEYCQFTLLRYAASVDSATLCRCHGLIL